MLYIEKTQKHLVSFVNSKRGCLRKEKTGDILDNHFGNHSGVPVEPTNPKPGDRGETGGVDGFEAKENEWGEIAFTPWED